MPISNGYRLRTMARALAHRKGASTSARFTAGCLAFAAASSRPTGCLLAVVPAIAAYARFERVGSFVATNATFYVVSVWLIFYSTTKLSYDRTAISPPTPL
jgi:hypothetical protein